MNILTYLPRFSQLRLALTLLLGLALLAPVKAFAVIFIKVITIYYFLGVEVWRTVEYIAISAS